MRAGQAYDPNRRAASPQAAKDSPERVPPLIHELDGLEDPRQLTPTASADDRARRSP